MAEIQPHRPTLLILAAFKADEITTVQANELRAELEVRKGQVPS